MKKWVFIIVLFLVISLPGVLVAYADMWNGGEHGTSSTYYVNFRCEITPNDINSDYEFYVSLPVNFPDSIEIDSIYGVNSEGKESSWGSASFFKKDGNVYYAKVVVSNTADVSYFKLYFRHSFDDFTTLFNVKSTMKYNDPPTPTPEPTETPIPTPTNTPTPKPTETPTPTPTNTPTPKPTETPTPTPTSTPTPTPTPAPILELNAYVDGNTAVAHYYTGGCTPVKSMIEYYEVDSMAGTLLKLNSETFISGSGTMRNSMEPGKVYRYKLTYIYEHSGVQFEKFLWSQDLYIVDQELEDYRNNRRITNFRTLMLYTWEEIMDLDIPVEGFKLKARHLFIWIMIASAAVFFWKKWNGG